MKPQKTVHHILYIVCSECFYFKRILFYAAVVMVMQFWSCLNVSAFMLLRIHFQLSTCKYV